MGNPRGLRDALAATRRDALAATRTDRATAHGPRAADPTAVQLPGPTGSCWLVGLSGGCFPALPTVVDIR